MVTLNIDKKLQPLYNVDHGDHEPDTSDEYPNTWYIITLSKELALNSVKAIQLCGQQLVLFRGPSGVVHCLFAYCPHLGANLGVGGHVVTESESGDDCIQCPFHGWRFGADGQCKRIPNLNNKELGQLNERQIMENGVDMHHFTYTHPTLINNALTTEYLWTSQQSKNIAIMMTMKLFDDGPIWVNMKPQANPKFTKNDALIVTCLCLDVYVNAANITMQEFDKAMKRITAYRPTIVDSCTKLNNTNSSSPVPSAFKELYELNNEMIPARKNFTRAMVHAARPGHGYTFLGKWVDTTAKVLKNPMTQTIFKLHLNSLTQLIEYNTVKPSADCDWSQIPEPQEPHLKSVFMMLYLAINNSQPENMYTAITMPEIDKVLVSSIGYGDPDHPMFKTFDDIKNSPVPRAFRELYELNNEMIPARRNFTRAMVHAGRPGQGYTLPKIYCYNCLNCTTQQKEKHMLFTQNFIMGDKTNIKHWHPALDTLETAFPYARNAIDNGRHVERQAVDWAFAASGLSRERYRRVECVVVMVAYCFPHCADSDRYRALCQAALNEFAIDDHLDTPYGDCAGDVAKARAVCDQLTDAIVEVCADAEPDRVDGACANVQRTRANDNHNPLYVVAERDVYARIAATYNAVQRGRLVRAYTRFINGWIGEREAVVEMRSFCHLDDFMKLRVESSGIFLYFQLIEFAANIYVPDEDWRHPELERLSCLLIRAGIMCSDLYSYGKELSAAGGRAHLVFNCVSVVSVGQGLTIDAAVERVVDEWRAVENAALALYRRLRAERWAGQHTGQYVRDMMYVIGGYWKAASTSYRYITI
ncbi:unnamed protein product [Medioppia subpectinata]|uniref:Rieske domain-containing protein n=1 Tax=Medioppia subpectinata TaxID=1979941 RepID=A0A7R9PV82_9ACAR|nr:unnamed protein product [Medioppia subpectinata]CAG2102392.1 unnamed protein product [Medioppia subpectinata]